MNPVLVNVWRGNAIENYHCGAAAVVDVNGRVVWSIGEIQRPIYPRSAIKLLQAVPLLDEKVSRKYGISRTELALACSSHTGEKMHREALAAWLRKIDCTSDDLECGEDYPELDRDRIQMISNGLPPHRACHCCSGNHAGFLTTCRSHGDQLHNYRLYSHPAQRRWFDILAEFTGLQALQLPWGYDGCGIPTLAIPLQRLAWAYARFADPSGLPHERRGAIETIKQAIFENPHMFGGTLELPTVIADMMNSELIVKNGAEGVYIGVLPNLGYGVALKVDSGNPQAARVALGAVLEKIAVLSVDQVNILSDYFRPDVLNSRHETVGRAEPSSAWDQGDLRF